MSGKVKANPGSGRICNLVMGVFRGGRAPIVQKIFAASILYIILWRRQWRATAAEQCLDTCASSCSSIKFPNVYWLLMSPS